MSAPHGQPVLRLRAMNLKASGRVVTEWHRHMRAPHGALFALAVEDESGRLRGVAIIGRPVNRVLDDGATAEVVRVATDGCPNACSFLYGAAARAARALGYRRILTYILETEPGTSLRAVRWRRVAETKGGEWSTPARPRRKAAHPTGPKVRWEFTWEPAA